ncbi:outer membrane protein assembly factor BamE [Massilia endophytica]|uniref:outer membrane protein assembly factor BamE n=1 Tax=Massilia endophytica TaxID=2899220 RepID=UPI001E5B3022|nr:outer membrane protein assembly factor BamE [Massilia endophytica]UGQ46929.1 outer membrane protein assembly factor BamE [Massilia endophytica]
MLRTALCLFLAVGAAHAQVQSVTVTTTRDPVDKSYRKMLKGMDRFESERSHAPGATLRFRLLPRLPGVRMEGIEMKVVGDTVTLPVPVAPDNSFTLERNAQAQREDAALVANRRTDSMTWRADVRSPGVPAGMRRLGDLRTECRVGIEAGLVSNNAHLFRWLSDLFTNPDAVCRDPQGNYLFFAERPLFAVRLHAGERHATLPFRYQYAGGTLPRADLPFCDCQVLLDRTYHAPIWDAGWPDDTLLEFEHMDDPAPPDAAPAPGIQPGQTAQEVRAALGPATEVRFDSGLQAWLYPPAERRGKNAGPEFIVLFGADGRVLKSRRN